MKLIIALIFSFNLYGSNYLQKEWEQCQKDSDCMVVQDLGCKNQCQSASINSKFLKSLNYKINKDCADILIPIMECAKDDRIKIPRCIKGTCRLMTKHVCCTRKEPSIQKAYSCHLKKVSCKEVLFK